MKEVTFEILWMFCLHPHRKSGCVRTNLAHRTFLQAEVCYAEPSE